MLRILSRNLGAEVLARLSVWNYFSDTPKVLPLIFLVSDIKQLDETKKMKLTAFFKEALNINCAIKVQVVPELQTPIHTGLKGFTEDVTLKAIYKLYDGLFAENKNAVFVWLVNEIQSNNPKYRINGYSRGFLFNHVYVRRDVDWHVIAHEIGHQLGFWDNKQLDNWMNGSKLSYAMYISNFQKKWLRGSRFLK